MKKNVITGEMSESFLDSNPVNTGITSVRSLPPHRMNNIRQLFEKNPGSPSSSSPSQSGSDNSTESHVNATQSKFASGDIDTTGSPRWRQHIQQPKNVEEQNVSPRRRPKTTVSPSRNSEDNFPKPSPRKSVQLNNDMMKELGKGLADLPMNNFGQLASAVIDTTEDSSSNARVSQLLNQMETGTDYQNTDAVNNRPLPAKRTHVSPSRLTTPNKYSNNQKPEKEHQQNMRTKEEEEKNNISDPTQLRVKSLAENSRPVSVMARMKMFEKTDNQSPSNSTSPNTPSPLTKPVKPQPPFRQRSFTETTEKTVEKVAKIPPKRPPFRQSSLIEKSTNGRDKELNKVSFVDQVENEKPMPPRKPPRTHVHDDYVKVKFEKETADKTEVPNSDSVDDSKTDFSNENTFPRSSVRKNRPSRPPPPRKPRPYSIAVDSMDFSGNSDSSDSEKNTKVMQGNNSSFFEFVAIEETDKANDPIKHWDLPRINHPEPIRRSLSSDCISKALDEEGNVIYMEPEKLGLDASDGFDIYVDDSGYAVPYRIIKKSKSSTANETENSRPIGDRVKSKFKKFKNLFSEQDKNVSVERRDSERGSHKWKLDAIKQKVDQAFDVLKGSVKIRNSVTSETGCTSSDITTDTDSKVDEKEIRKRVEYSRSVRMKTSQSIKESFRMKDIRFPQLFEHAMIIGLELREDSSEYTPVMKYKFPEIKDSNVSVPLFCFPDAANFKPSSSSSKSQSYNFVLTNIDGGRVYGYCRRFVPPKSPNKIPEVICIISPVNAFKMYNSLLEEIETKRRISTDSAQELISAAFGRPLPAPGQTETIRTLDQDGEMETLYLSREAENRVENVNCESALTSLGVDKMLKVFASILNERSVLFCAKTLSNLSSTINGITSLLYPFSWQHTFVPVLPAEMIDVTCSPTPFIMGITSSLMAKALTLPLEENVLVVDLDKKSFVRSQGDEGILLPGKMTKALKTSLNMCRIDSEAKSVPDLMISEAFLRFFIEVMGHYGQYIHTENDGQKTFQKEDFVKGASSNSIQQLLEWFVETQMFEVFTTEEIEKKEWGSTIEFFQNRVQEVKCNAGNVINKEPEKLGLSSSGGFDIYVDDSRSAVPHKTVKKSKSSTSNETENSRPIGDRVKSKFNKFKNLFSEQDKIVSVERRGIGRGSHKWKQDAIKQKVDQAFDVLKGSVKIRNSVTSETDCIASEITTDTDSKVDEKEIRKRVEYSRSVRIKTSKSIKDSFRMKDTRFPQLFEHAMIIGLTLPKDSSEYIPVIKYKFPNHKDPNVFVSQFCFPDAANFKPSLFSSKSQSYKFVLTNIDGSRVYGYCRRFVPPKSPNKIPEVICIISPVNAFKMYNSLLDEIETKRRISTDSAQELIAGAFGRPLPAPGQMETIRTLHLDGEMETLVLGREAENRVENVNCESALTSLGVDKMLKVFASILNERSVLFCAKTLSNLSSTINGITSLLYPFSWQHTFVPVLPAEMIDVTCCPTPFIMGIPSSLMAKALTLPLEENVLVVDLDRKSFVRSQGDEGILLPGQMTKALKTSLNMCKIDSEAKSVPDLMISEAFLRFFIEVMGHYGQFIHTDKDGQKTFQKEDFVEGASSNSIQQLLEWFVETQMFEVFTTEHIEKKERGSTIEFFQSRVQEVKCNAGREN